MTKLIDRRLNREACGDDCRIDADRALFEFHCAHSSMPLIVRGIAGEAYNRQALFCFVNWTSKPYMSKIHAFQQSS